MAPVIDVGLADAAASAVESYQPLSPRHVAPPAKKARTDGGMSDSDQPVAQLDGFNRVHVVGSPVCLSLSLSTLALDDIPEPEFTTADHIPLTSHTDTFGVDPIPISWGHPDPNIRGPVICTVRHSAQRNAIGAHQGSYCIYTGKRCTSGWFHRWNLSCLESNDAKRPF